MAFYLHSGDAHIEYYPKKASTAIAEGALLQFESGTGYVTVATSTSTEIVGISQRVVAATDSDYASNTSIPVIVPGPQAVLYGLVTGTFAATNVGGYLDLSDAYTVNADASSVDAVACVGYIDSTHGLFKLNSAYMYMNTA